MLLWENDRVQIRTPHTISFSLYVNTPEFKTNVWGSDRQKADVAKQFLPLAQNLLACSDHATQISHLFLNGEKLDDVLVVEFLQHFKLSHLHVQRPQEAEVVEDLDGIEVTCFLQKGERRLNASSDIYCRSFLASPASCKLLLTPYPCDASCNKSWTEYIL